MDFRRIIVLLEKVKDDLGVAPSDQSKPAQQNKTSTAAARAKLKELSSMSKSGRSKANELHATGAPRK
jgi:hypothetical protein